MTQSIDRRRFLAGSLGAAGLAADALAAPSAGPSQGREWYELRKYRISARDRRARLLGRVSKALLPAWKRAGVSRVGVFVAAEDGDDHDVVVLLAFPALTVLGELDDRLAADKALAEASREHRANPDDAPDGGPDYSRIESRLLQAFTSIPAIELPEQTESSAPRVFELRTYESATMDQARRKVEMFDTGETQLMRDVGLAPVFFGATRIGHDVPNLTYLLSASDMDAHGAHWEAFLAHPEWARMKNIPRYVNTVSKITNSFLRPADCSEI